MDGLATDIERCPDGVEIVHLPARGLTMTLPDAARTVFRYRTGRREPLRITIADLENPIVIAFVNAIDDERRQRFFTQFGLPNPKDGWHRQRIGGGIHHDDVLKNQTRFSALLQNAAGDDAAAAMTAVNSSIAEHSEFNLRPTFHLAGQRGAPRLLLKSESLIGFMLMETAMILANSARLAECEQCSTIFLTGHLTGRRSHARFCSDRCRVAAMRARNAANA